MAQNNGRIKKATESVSPIVLDLIDRRNSAPEETLEEERRRHLTNLARAIWECHSHSRNLPAWEDISARDRRAFVASFAKMRDRIHKEVDELEKAMFSAFADKVRPKN